MGLRMPAVASAVLLCAGLLAVPAGALASGPPAPPPSHPAAGHPVTGHRQICRGSCRGTGPVHRVHPPENPKYRKPAKLAEVPAGSWGFDMNGWGCNGTSFEAGAAPAGITNAPGLAFDSIQLNGWGWADMSLDNKCFNAELQWYQQNDAGNPIQFIMFPVPYNTNDCGSYSQNTSQGYSAGWGQAQMIYNKAVAAG